MSSLEDQLTWLDLHKETIIDPERPIVDPHHHLWPGESHYLLEDLWLDTHGGHNVKKTVFIECSQEYLTSGDIDFAPVGETRFVKKISDKARKENSEMPSVQSKDGWLQLVSL